MYKIAISGNLLKGKVTIIGKSLKMESWLKPDLKQVINN